MRRRPPEIPCPKNNEGCKYAPNCHLSEHHTWPRRLGKVAIGEALAEGDPERAHRIKRFIEHPMHKPMVCRMIHDLMDKLTPDELPDDAHISRFLEANSGD